MVDVPTQPSHWFTMGANKLALPDFQRRLDLTVWPTAANHNGKEEPKKLQFNYEQQ